MTGNTIVQNEPLKHSQLLARLTGLLFIVTFATSIPPVVSFYVAALSDPAFVLGGGFDRNVSMGALLELLLIAANIGTALTLYPVLKKGSPVLSLGYVAARLTECGFIAMGLIALMALNTLRMKGSNLDESALLAIGQSLVALHDWTFRIGPGIIVGVGNGLMLGYMMWKTRLVPRAMSILGLVGGPAILVSGFAVLFGYIEPASTPQIIATIPEFFWELSLGIWLLVKGFDRQALADLGTGHAASA
jgi:Domain of unknown function (DUF4386)